jgi:hypothetical protein
MVVSAMVVDINSYPNRRVKAVEWVVSGANEYVRAIGARKCCDAIPDGSGDARAVEGGEMGR